MLIVYSLAIFISAFLLFLIQPMFARMALPMLGGAPAVWNTAMVFYQAALLCGYAYAHVTTAWLGVRRQSLLHLFLMALAVFTLPITLPLGWKPPAAANPTFWLLSLLTYSIGLPFFVISSTSPLLQKWFSSTGHKYSSDPYFLYAASNLGSMLALLSYTALFEPLMTLQQQSWSWSMGYLAVGLVIGFCAVLLRTCRRKPGDVVPDLVPDPAMQMSPVPTRHTANNQPVDCAALERNRLTKTENLSATHRRLRWIALAFVPSSLMLSVTTYLTTDIAAVPLLWIIPLAIYLLSFILVFARRPPLPHIWMIKAMPIVSLPLVFVLNVHGNPIVPVILLHLLAFFLVAMVCHGELARDRPSALQLTEFYLFLSFGGVLGGIFNALIAPLVFNSVAEYPITVVVACLLLPWTVGPSNLRTRIKDIIWPGAIGLASIFLGLAMQRLGIQAGLLAMAILFGLPLIITFSFSRRPIRFGLSVGAIFLASAYFAGNQEGVLFTERSFFGVSRITQDGRIRQFMHGTTLHGSQWIDPSRHREPVAYYFRTGPLGQFFTAFDMPSALRNVAIVGLGAGGITGYAKSGQKWTYFEIDPAVERIARDPRFFTYLRDCPSDLRVVLGDGRLSLSAVPDGFFDVLILDAYNSDSMPMHLLTREALQLYLAKLALQGALIFHISNRYLDLEPVLANLAREARLYCLVQSDQIISKDEKDQGKTPSRYLIMSRNKADLGSLSSDKRWASARTRDDVGIWTDNYSSILKIFK